MNKYKNNISDSDVSEELHFLDKSVILNSKCSDHYGVIANSQLCIDGSNKKAICSVSLRQLLHFKFYFIFIVKNV